MSLKNAISAIALLSSLSLAACSNTAAGVEQDARENADKAATAADRARISVPAAIPRCGRTTSIVATARRARH